MNGTLPHGIRLSARPILASRFPQKQTRAVARARIEKRTSLTSALTRQGFYHHAVLFRILCRREFSERLVGPIEVISDPPGLDDRSRIREILERVEVQARASEFSVKQFDERVLHGLAKLDELKLEN